MKSPSFSLRRISYWVTNGSKFHQNSKAGIFEVIFLELITTLKTIFMPLLDVAYVGLIKWLAIKIPHIK